jgi:hypothetical protein
MSIHDYADSNKIIDNFFTRSLLDIAQDAQISANDLATAKSVLRQKFIIGIFEWYNASIARFEKYMGWWEKYNVESDKTINQCHLDEVSAHSNDAGKNPDVPTGGTTWNKIVIRNWADLELYFYAKHLYSEQSVLFEK